MILEFVADWLIDESLIIKLENCSPIEEQKKFQKKIWLDFFLFVNAIKSSTVWLLFDRGKIIKRYLKDHWFKGYYPN